MLQGILSTVARPFFLRKLIDHVGQSDDWDSYVGGSYVVALLATLMLEGLACAAARVFLADRFGAALLATWAGIIHSKALRVATGAAENEKSLLSNDVLRELADPLYVATECWGNAWWHRNACSHHR